MKSNKLYDINHLGDMLSKIIPIPYTNTSLADNLKSFGIKVMYFNSDSYHCYGMLFWNRKSKKPVIAVNSLLNHDQMNFFLAHELGHLLVNYYWSPYDCKCKAKFRPTEYCGNTHHLYQDKKNELIVNQVAESYLMPSHLIKPLIISNQEKNLFNFVTINQMLYKFKVPRTRAKQRFYDYVHYANLKS